ncbi:MAG TPA: LEA type 2 family protein [Longimicrobiaceae bacterium]|nr:LEA type 2 family protein [Longimicrobiaceae bacterium]
MRLRSRARFLASLAAAVLLGSCGTFGFREPRVELESVQLGGLGLRGGTLLVSLVVENPNGFSLTAESLSYNLAVRDSETPGDTAWIDFATGTYNRPFTVGAGETETVQIPVEFAYSGLGGAAASILRAGTFDYRASGTVDVQTPIGSRAVPFRKRGTVTMAGVR